MAGIWVERESWKFADGLVAAGVIGTDKREFAAVAHATDAERAAALFGTSQPRAVDPARDLAERQEIARSYNLDLEDVP